MNSIRRTLNDLLACGWVRDGGVLCQTYPATDHIVLQKAGKFLRHWYRIYDDTSDCPNDDVVVEWEYVEVYEVTTRTCRPCIEGVLEK